ncbi:hypothetical protein [Trichlorobacter lovleyi]|uniref:hypothetical protein n=1 Tax=Trichlorobacter lovleyi TaxID=313985 RepID=UPI003D0D850C
MSEKGIAIADQASGTKVATRDAVEQTSASEPRVIQLVDFASRSLTAVQVRSVTIADSAANVDTNADLLSSRITVGDKSTLVVVPIVSGTVSGITVTPVLYAADNNVIGILAPKSVAAPAVPLQLVSTDVLLDIMAWDLFGAASVALHLSEISGAGTVVLKGGVV